MTSPLFPRARVVEGKRPHPDRHRLACSPAIHPAGPSDHRNRRSGDLGQAMAPHLSPRERGDPCARLGQFSRPELGGGSDGGPPVASWGELPRGGVHHPRRVPRRDRQRFGHHRARGPRGHRSRRPGSPGLLAGGSLPGVEGVTVSPASGILDVVDGRSATPLRVTAGSPGDLRGHHRPDPGRSAPSSPDLRRRRGPVNQPGSGPGGAGVG